MDQVFAKLNLKDENSLVILGAPVSFERILATLKGVRVMRTAPSTGSIPFALAFATTQAQVDAAVRQIVPRAADDIKLWIAYPKQTSTRFTCEFNRDTGWDTLGASGYERVSQVSLDDDWSAIRFRRVEHIPMLMRDPNWALTPQGRDRATAARAEAGIPAVAPANTPPAVNKKPAVLKKAAAKKKPAPKQKPAKKQKPAAKKRPAQKPAAKKK